MPTYRFVDASGIESDHTMRMSELDDFKASHPDWKQIIMPSTIIAGQTVSGGKLPDAFKDNLREMKNKHPLSTGVDHLI